MIKFLEISLIMILITLQSSTFLSEEDVPSAINSIVSLYNDYDLVHIGERHWSLTDYQFRVSLIHDEGFQETVDDIIIESGNSLYQGILDDYVLSLDDVHDSLLCKIWQNTIVTSGVWDAKIYKQFITEVRNINSDRVIDKRIRVVAAGSPVDWSQITEGKQLTQFMDRSYFGSSIIKREVLDKGRNGLIIFGGAHFYRSGNSPQPGRLRSMLEEDYDKRIVFVILPLSGNDKQSLNYNSKIAPDVLPSFINAHSLPYVDLDASQFFSEGTGKLNDFTDGILFFGIGEDSISSIDERVSEDSLYQEELNRRLLLKEQFYDSFEYFNGCN